MIDNTMVAVFFEAFLILGVAFICWRSSNRELGLMIDLQIKISDQKKDIERMDSLLGSNVSSVATHSLKLQSLQKALEELNASVRLASGQLKVFQDILDQETKPRPGLLNRNMEPMPDQVLQRDPTWFYDPVKFKEMINGNHPENKERHMATSKKKVARKTGAKAKTAKKTAKRASKK